MLDKMFSEERLAKAWQHIRNGQNLRYKYQFKHIYRGYELALQENLKALSATLCTGGFVRNDIVRMFLPKGTNSQRPITLLPIEDQIAYQAVAAYIAEHIVDRRRKVEFKTVFSNIISENRESYLFENWKPCYLKFQDETEKKVKKGFRWVITCDLASFYDTISHDILFDQTNILKKHTQDRTYLSTILYNWTFENKLEARKHGLPQGPISSDFLAEVFLLALDENLLGKVNYIRYVDDIRIFAKTRAEAQRQSLMLERFLRGLGLVPQPEKFSIRKLKTGQELHKIESSQSYSYFDEEDPDEVVARLNASDTSSVLKDAFKNPEKPNPTLVRYALFRGTPNNRTIVHALEICIAFPQFVEPGLVFLKRTDSKARVISLCMSLLNESPFGYVKLKSWEYLIYALGSLSRMQKRNAVDLAIKVMKKQKNEETPNIIGAASFLLRYSHIHKTKHWKYTFNTSSRMCLALSLRHLSGRPSGISELFLNRLLSDLPDVGLGTLDYHHLLSTDLHKQIRKKRKGTAFERTLLALSNSKSDADHDTLNVGIEKLFDVQLGLKVTPLLGNNWYQAFRYVQKANVYKTSSPSIWLRSVNGLAEVFVRQLARSHNRRFPKSKITLKDKNKILNYGQLLNPVRPLAKNYPTLVDDLRKFNRARNEDEESHALNDRTGRKSKKAVTHAQAKKLSKVVGNAIKNVAIKIYELNQP